MSEYEGKYDRRLLARCRKLEAENKLLNLAYRTMRGTMENLAQSAQEQQSAMRRCLKSFPVDPAALAAEVSDEH